MGPGRGRAGEVVNRVVAEAENSAAKGLFAALGGFLGFDLKKIVPPAWRRRTAATIRAYTLRMGVDGVGQNSSVGPQIAQGSLHEIYL